VVEQVKREFLRAAPNVARSNGKKRAKGIWQYTESGLLVVPAAAAPEEDRVEEDPLIRVLEGKTK
jgi:hypothetical protein